MHLSHTVRHYREAFLRLVYPAHCGACQTLLELEEAGVCGNCREALQRIRLQFEETSLEISFEHLNQAWALYPYHSPIKEILTGIKFNNKRWLIQVFSEELGELGRLIAADTSYDCVVPIPLENSKLIERQFNQSELIARLVAKNLNCRVTDILKKCHSTPSQSRLNREERLVNLHFAFEAKFPVTGKNILLVDDVLTTGATAEEAARVLKEKGAKRVDLVTLACNPRDVEMPQPFSPLYI